MSVCAVHVWLCELRSLDLPSIGQYSCASSPNVLCHDGRQQALSMQHLNTTTEYRYGHHHGLALQSQPTRQEPAGGTAGKLTPCGLCLKRARQPSQGALVPWKANLASIHAHSMVLPSDTQAKACCAECIMQAYRHWSQDTLLTWQQLGQRILPWAVLHHTTHAQSSHAGHCSFHPCM